MDKWADIVSSLLVAAFGLAIVAVLVSKSSSTGSVLTSAGTAISGLINAAVSPVTGNTTGMSNAGLWGSVA